MKNHKALIILLTLVTPVAVFAQEAAAAAAAQSDWYTWTLENIFIILGFTVILAALGALFYLNTQLMEVQKIRLLQEHGIDVMEKANLMPKRDNIFKRMYDRLTDAVPVEKERDILLDHDYDGIGELDNSLPPWWLWMFYVTIGIAVVYMGYYHFSDAGGNQDQWYEEEVAAAEKEVRAYLASQSNKVDENTVEALIAEEDLSLGKTIYDANCAACHGTEGQGGVGPNMTDKYWIHGGGIADIFKTVKYGVPEKGMISWKAQLRPIDMQRVSSYILTFQGTNPPGAKEPQGELYEPSESEGPAEEATDEQSDEPRMSYNEK